MGFLVQNKRGFAMNSLKFSHSYLKLPNQWEGKKATLLFVREIELEKQTEWFKVYDTVVGILDGFVDSAKRLINGLTRLVFQFDAFRSLEFIAYPLPKKGKYLLLLFECEGTVFTTLRRSTPEKKLYYEKECEFNQPFELVRT